MTRDELKEILKRNPHLSTNDDSLKPRLPDTQPQPHKRKTLGGKLPGQTESLPRVSVRFIGYRTRPCDPDNFAGSVKHLLDGLRHAGLIPGDDPWQITLETAQVKVSKKALERTDIIVLRQDS